MIKHCYFFPSSFIINIVKINVLRIFAFPGKLSVLSIVHDCILCLFNTTFLRIRSDNNIDKSIEVLSTWLNRTANEYHGVDTNFNEKSIGFEDENGIAHWSTQRFLHVIKLREDALNAGRNIWADFVWVYIFFTIYL